MFNFVYLFDVFAKVLDAPLEEVLLRAGLTTPEEAPRLAPGFADGDATPFTGKPQEKERATEKARLFGGNSPGIDVWTVQTNALILNGFIPGDQLVVDTHQSELCKAGDIVIAQKYDWQSGTAVTLLRRFEPPVLVSASPDPNEQRVQIVDGNNVVIKGKVIASWRASKS